VPVNVDRQWRPYTYGRWAYTGRYGWRWNSDKQFGWATYHCGRWGFFKPGWLVLGAGQPLGSGLGVMAVL